jgi:hypothetical protein
MQLYMRAMFAIFSDAALTYFYEHEYEWYSVKEVSMYCAEFFTTLLLSSSSVLSEKSTRGYR